MTDVLPLVAVTMTQTGAARFGVRAQPRAKSSGVHAVRDGDLVVKIAAPPVDGAANAELVDTLARALGVRRADVAVVRGASSHRKVVEVQGLAAEEVAARLARAIG